MRRRADAGGLVDVLEGDGNAVQRPLPLAALQRRIGAAGGAPRRLGLDEDEAAEAAVLRGDAREAILDESRGGEAAGGEGAARRGSGERRGGGVKAHGRAGR